MYKFINWVYNSIRGGRMKKTYTIIVHKEDDIFWGECKEIEGCFAQANTIEELKERMIESIYLYYSSDEASNKVDTKKIELDVSYA